MTPEQLKEFFDTYFYYIILAGFVFGLAVGSLPLILGIRKNKRNLGVVAIAVCAITGALSPLLCLIVAAIFTVVILIKPKASDPAEVKVVNQTPIDVSMTSGQE